MNILDYYKQFSYKINENIEKTLDSSHDFHTLLTKNRSFSDDFDKWIAILGDVPETDMYKNAAKVYQEAFGNMLMGLYQPAFMGLRYFLERTLTGVYYSCNELELRTWLRGDRDTYWSEIIGKEDEDINSTMFKGKKIEYNEVNVNSGLFSLKVTRAFFPEIADSAKTFRKLTGTVYRNCSEYVHGNPSAINEIGLTIDFSSQLVKKWNDMADTVARCILYVLFMRYWKFLKSEQKAQIKERIKEEFSATDILKDNID